MVVWREIFIDKIISKDKLNSDGCDFFFLFIELTVSVSVPV